MQQRWSWRRLRATASRGPRGRDEDLARRVVAGVPAEATIVVLAPAESTLADEVRSLVPGAEVEHVVDPPGEVHARLTALAPFDVVVDAHRRAGRVVRFRDTFAHLVAGGRFIVASGADELGARRTKLGKLIASALDHRGGPFPGRGRGMSTSVLDAYGLGLLLRDVRADGDHLVVTRDEHLVLAKMREHEMNDYLDQVADGRDQVIEVISAAPFTSRCQLRESTSTPRPNFPSAYETIDLSLRSYHDVVVAPGGVLATDRVIAPETYRHNQFKRLRNRAIDEIAPRFGVLRADATQAPLLEGTYVHLDNEQRGHFGHLLTEQVSRFWTWTQAKELYPDAKLLVAINKGRELRGWELEVYAAGGIPEEDVVMVRGAVRVQHVVAGTPMLSNPDYVHPAIVPVWRSVGDRLEASSATDRPLPTRFFCSRRLDKRSCHNQADVEREFESRGFTVLYPEDLSLGDQVRLFRGADVIGGFVGSGLFSLMYATDSPKHVVMVGSSSYTARNEYLFAALLGHRIDSVVCRPDDPSTYQSAYTYDPRREGRFLREVLDGLGR